MSSDAEEDETNTNVFIKNYLLMTDSRLIFGRVLTNAELHNLSIFSGFHISLLVPFIRLLPSKSAAIRLQHIRAFY